MSYSLFLDDERHPKTERSFIVVRSFDEAVQFVEENGIPEYISFDHDLGTGESGYDFAKWICTYMLDNIGTAKMFEWNVHSANPVGAENINAYLRNFSEYWG